MQKRQSYRGGFALPTVLIASVVMLTILAASVSSVATVRNGLKVQYYEQLAKIAGEAGVAYAKACLAKNGNVPLWTDNKPLTPATDCAGNQMLAPAVDVLVVAGGGGGGAGIGGGGGGGGVVVEEAIPVGTGGITVTVGSGGAGGPSQSSGGNGSNSRFGSVEADGGGGGGGRVGGTTYIPAGDGGSGGGGNGTYDSGTGTGALGGSGVPGQGYDGGMGSAGSTSPYAGNGGGGGGAGAAGGNASGLAISEGTSGDGGIGLLSDFSGQQVYYGAGGAGGRYATGTIGSPGITGGGVGGCCDAVTGGAGQPNTGGGGGGGSSGNGLGGAGGSGVVIVRYGYNAATPSITATGGTRYDSGPYRIHRFTSSGTFNVTALGTASCPSDPRCSVTVNDNLRSSFRIARPPVDESGRAISIPNNGYVELLRDSNGEVWRTYRQPAAQVAVVPDLCSGAAAGGLGWNNAIRATTQSGLPGITTAQTITVANEPLNAGRMYYRKDFTVNQAGNYSVIGHSGSTADNVQLYIDGALVTTVENTTASNTIALSPGCHTITAKVLNKTLLPRTSQFTAAVRMADAEPVVATDTTWRVSTGTSVHFSEADFYADPSIWVPANDFDLANRVITSWASNSGDAFTRLISADCSSSCPPSSSTYFRDSRDFIVSSNTEVLVSALCDDDCTVYVDGNQVIGGSIWSNINQQTLTLTAGRHNIGVRSYNSGSAANPSKFAVAVYNKANGEVLSRTDRFWLTANNQWVSGTNVDNDPMSYEDSFEPSPTEIAVPRTLDVLVVGGGGGGGGNCPSCAGAGGGGGGGVSFQQQIPAATGSYTVQVGAGGGGGSGGSSRSNGVTGGSSRFGSFIVTGGGGGGSQFGTPGLNGGSGGGGSGGGSPSYGAGGTGISGQGFPGGSGIAAPHSGGGGGGASGPGVSGVGTVGGNGGPGFISFLTGVGLTAGAGGGAGVYDANTPGVSDVGAGNGANQSVNSGNGYAASTGTKSAGGGGGGANGRNRGGAGGAGGNGTVIIRIKTGSMSVTASGASASTVTIAGVQYTVYRYNSTGSFTFTINSIN